MFSVFPIKFHISESSEPITSSSLSYGVISIKYLMFVPNFAYFSVDDFIFSYIFTFNVNVFKIET